MFRKILNRTVCYCMVILSFTACTKDYITGGTIQNTSQYVNMSTYDVLNQFQQFDTLVQLIDAAGLKDTINQEGTTFFGVSNLSVLTYLALRTRDVQSVNQYAQFGLDSLLYYVKNNINHTADSLLMYLINANTTPQNLTEIGNIFPSHLAGDSVIVSYEQTLDGTIGYTSIVSTPAHVVYLTQLWQHYNLGPDSTAGAVPSSTGSRSLVSTAFINTKNGVLNVLNSTLAKRPDGTYINGTPLFFYGTKQ